ncbi:MAG TPA: SGNH/GDSL hydrolase family protein [Candidatus Binatus sp.]|nr:SGNH/GDSL hydrolase family protein [Candidatus Binatus sp.]
MNKDDQRILRARKGWNPKEWIVCAIILILAANAAPAILGSTVSGIPSGSDLDRKAKQWIGTWATAAQPFIPESLQAYRNQSLRLIVHTSVGGKRVRIKISNTYGDRPLLIGGAHIARRTAEAEIDPRSDRMLKFQGKSSTTIPAGSMVVSDPVEMDVPGLSDLAVSLFLPQLAEARTSHSLAMQTSYVSPETGDSTAVVKFPVAKAIHSWPFLTGVDVEASPGSAAIVAFGSSLTDGDGTTADTNGRWTDVLAKRLQKGAEVKVEIGVLNEGIIGNRLLHDSPKGADNPFGAGLGQAGLARFERDVLAQAGVRYVIVGLGINDILFPAFPFTPPSEKVSAEDIISGYRQLIARGHQEGVRVIGTTNPPFENSAFEGLVTAFYTPERETVRQKVNDWIRGSGEFDGVVDLDAVLRDPSRPTQLLPAYDSGDHLHPNNAGCIAEGNAFPLALFAR